jgi:hypothetical protein
MKLNACPSSGWIAIYLVLLSALSPGVGHSAAPAPSSAPSPVSSPSPGSLPDSLPAGAAAVPAKISPYERNRLRVEFKRAQANELRALEHRHAFELKDLKASQNVRQKEWEKKETEARHKFFAENSKSPDRRTYVQDFIARRKTFRQILTDERNRRAQEQKVRQSSVKEDQIQRLKDFESHLQKGERPPSHLWPRPGG